MKIVIAGAGLVGLSSALLLARDGHEVTVVERDARRPDGSVGGVGGVGAPGRQPVPSAPSVRVPIPGRAARPSCPT